MWDRILQGEPHCRISSSGAGGGGSHRGISFKFKYLVKFELICETALGYESGVVGQVLIKKPIQKILYQSPFNSS